MPLSLHHMNLSPQPKPSPPTSPNTICATTDVQILAESALRKDKAELLEGFNGAVRAKVEVWNEANKERERRIREGKGKKVWEERGERDYEEEEGEEGE
jgi:hypothetical protein